MHIPVPTEGEACAALRDGLSELHRLGLTGVHAFPGVNGASGSLGFHVYQRAEAEGDLTARVWMLLPGDNLDEAVTLGLRTGMGSDMLRVGHLKYFADGSQGARTAWMSEPYEDVPGSGFPIVPAEELAELTRRADRAGLAVAIHAIGDQANHTLIEALSPVIRERRGAETVLPTAPHRIEHAQMLQAEDVVHIGRLGLVGSVQPIHATDDIPMIERSVGSRAYLAYLFNDMQRAGITLAFGSDGPVADINPFYGIHAAVTRQRRNGTPAGGWHPAQCLSLADAIRGYTFGPAIASGRRAELGSIAPGKLADLIVLDRDIFAIGANEIPETTVFMTVVGGNVVYRR
jgi:predicted amidohydrolase YtcJ